MTEYFLKICQTNKKAYYFYYNGIVTPEDPQDEDTENVVAKYKPSKNADSILIDDNDNPLALLIPSLKKINDFPTVELEGYFEVNASNNNISLVTKTGFYTEPCYPCMSFQTENYLSYKQGAAPADHNYSNDLDVHDLINIASIAATVAPFIV